MSRRGLRLAAAAAAGVAGALASRCEASPPPSASLSAAPSASLLSRVVALEHALLRPPPLPRLIVICPTFYPRLDDARCQLGLESCRRAKALGIPLLLVDASPPEVREALAEAGAEVREQSRKGKKGTALRECVELALAMVPDDGIICYQELEKVEMIALQREVCGHMLRSGADICVPRREDSLFRRSYPVEQWHSENFANLYLDALGSAVGLPTLDWTFGPVAFRATMAHHWLRCEGELWDAQIVPYINAAIEGARVEGVQVSYSHPAQMKREEESLPVWSEKRLMQLDFLFKYVAEPLKARAQ
ncbi:hypothetical protein AB1Y20_002755 [Prymnesium parvum]|uniref:Uncharacterized protein n=1 Tax=Prymnesium parvum TaxID=97485 RepID=A0AB34JAG3_PRYPA